MCHPVVQCHYPIFAASVIVKSRGIIEETAQDTIGEENEGAITQLSADGSEFRKPSTSSMPNYRLPTPGGALPAGRLPPLNRDDTIDSGSFKFDKVR